MVSVLNPDLRVGFHIPKLPTLFDTFDRMINLPLLSYQTYISNGRAWLPPQPDIADLRRTKSLLQRYDRYACVHGCLLYNLAGATKGRDDPNYQRNLNNTCMGLISELDISSGFGAGVVVHIGSRQDRKRGIHTIARTIEHCLRTPSTATRTISKGMQIPVEELLSSRKIILENSAGEGSKIGSNLEEIAQIIDSIDPSLRPQVRVCIDTAHIFGAGQYDLGSVDEVDRFYSDFDRTIGLDRLELFHLNDSRVPFGSRKDRHENIALGYIFSTDRDQGDGTEGLKRLVDRAETLRIPLVGEPPRLTASGTPGPGGRWDYVVLKEYCHVSDDFYCD